MANELEQRARELFALQLDEASHHTEADNVRRGIDLESYAVELRAVEAALQQAQQPSDSATEKLAAMLQGLEFQPVAATMPASVLGTACAAIAKQAKRAADSEAQQPGAQAVESSFLGWVRRAAIEKLRTDDEVTGVMVHAEEQTDSLKVYTAPPPLPEGVSEEDVNVGEATWMRVCVEEDRPSRDAVRAIIEQYRARLAAKGGV